MLKHGTGKSINSSRVCQVQEYAKVQVSQTERETATLGRDDSSGRGGT
jgi:hypothetical protein